MEFDSCLVSFMLLRWSLALGISLGVCENNIRSVMRIWIRLFQDFFNNSCLIFIVFWSTYARVCILCVEPRRHLQTCPGGCRITFHQRGPREQPGFFSATWLGLGCSANPPFLPHLPPKPPGPSLRQNYKRSLYCWQLSPFYSLLPSLSKTPALPPLAADTASTGGEL